MGETGLEEINVNASKVAGGYFISYNGGSRIETSLNKVMQFVEEKLSEELAVR